MDAVDPRLVRALERQLESWRELLDSGAERIGWKLGIGGRERIGEGFVVVYLTSATQLAPGAVLPTDGTRLNADAEVAVRVGRGSSIEAYGPALELVELDGADDPEEIVAGNVFHRAFALGPFVPAAPEVVQARLLLDGHVAATKETTVGLAGRVRRVADVLARVGLALRPGDCIITGNVVQVPLASARRVEADLGPLGSVGIRLRRGPAVRAP